MTQTKDTSEKLLNENLLPRKIAVQTDDPPSIVGLINTFNEAEFSVEAFQRAVELIDDLRKEYKKVTNPDLAK